MFTKIGTDVRNPILGQEVLKLHADIKSDLTKILLTSSDRCNLVSWSKEWQMLFNVEKCKVMHIGYHNMNADYLMDAVKRKHVNEEKGLEVIIREDWKWEKNSVVVQ